MLAVRRSQGNNEEVRGSGFRHLEMLSERIFLPARKRGSHEITNDPYQSDLSFIHVAVIVRHCPRAASRACRRRSHEQRSRSGSEQRSGPPVYRGVQRLSDSRGFVRVGYQADLVVLEGNPLDDLRNTRRIVAVVSRGTLLTRQELDERLQRLRAASPSAVP